MEEFTWKIEACGLKSQLQLTISIEGNCYHQAWLESKRKTSEEAIMNTSINKKGAQWYTILETMVPDIRKWVEEI